MFRADQAAADPATASSLSKGVHWLWIAVPAALVLIAFGVIFQLYRSSSRTLTEQTPIAQIDATGARGVCLPCSRSRFVGSYVRSGWKARDGGRAWTQSALDVAPAAMAVSPSGEGYAYVFTGSSIHVTADSGQTWQEVQGTLPSAQILAAAVNAFAPTEIYASFAESGLFRSRDGGRFWELVATPDDEKIVAILVSGITPLLFIALEIRQSAGEQR